MTPNLVCAKYGGWDECNDMYTHGLMTPPGGSIHLSFEIDPTPMWEGGLGGSSIPV